MPQREASSWRPFRRPLAAISLTGLGPGQPCSCQRSPMLHGQAHRVPGPHGSGLVEQSLTLWGQLKGGAQHCVSMCEGA